MPPTAFPGFCDATYQTRDGLWNASRAVNWYPAADASGHAKSKISLQPTPGLHTFCDVPAGGPGSSPPVRGLWAGDERLFTVVGGQLFEISAAGVATLQGEVLSAATPVQFAASGTSLLIASGDQIFRATGGTVAQTYDGAISVVYLDGYYIILLVDSNTVQISDLNSDGTIWDPLDQQTKMGSTDRLVRLETHEGHLWLFGRNTIEVWYNSGDPDFPFARISGSSIDQGTSNPYTVAQVDRKLYWLGRDVRGRGRVFRTEGYTPVVISNQAIEYLIDSYLDGPVDQVVTGYGYHEDGQTFYVLSFPRAQACLVYDLATNMWHERARWDASQWVQWRGASFHAHVFGRHIVARTSEAPFPDTDHRKIYEQNVQFPDDDGIPIRRYRIAPYVQAEQQFLQHHYLRLYTDATSPIFMRYQNDEGAWSGARVAVPFRREVKYRRLGRARDRLYEIQTSNSVMSPMIVDAWLNLSPSLER
jgi:hypothetical protein